MYRTWIKNLNLFTYESNHNGNISFHIDNIDMIFMIFLMQVYGIRNDYPSESEYLYIIKCMKSFKRSLELIYDRQN